MLTILDNFLDAQTVRQINAEWPLDSWSQKSATTSKKWSSPNLPPAARAVVDGFDIQWLERVTGIPDLIADPDLFGAGLHCIPPGGFLHLHVDFNRHPQGWHRRVNVLIYLNEAWPGEWGGDLQYGLGEASILIPPMAGRCVVFETTDASWHGHPHPLKCPPDRLGRSLALYFYTREPPAEPAHSTIYRGNA
jgi:Rps23 Pro-64 3,4-dihydroxylase Tpa1-like proline 4-hydroxylase